jgi:hypothetical protein
MVAKVLFVLKRREDYNPIKHSPKGLSTGLFNSASFMNDMLNEAGVRSEIEVAIDNNCIDRLVNNHKPTHVIIEALWVIPTKFAVLTKLHPKVKWIIRLHSELPFLAGEGMSFNWIGDYADFPQIIIGVNAPRMMNEVKAYLQTAKGWTDQQVNEKIVYMPNYYPQDYKTKEFNRDKFWVDIGCFGAIRPLKNHMVQAIAAIKFANKLNKQLRFHINIGRIEMQGNPVLNNLRAMFEHLRDSGHQLVGHEWRPREQFLELCGTMDIGLQCNFSETFNIVTADLISQGVPVVGSYEIPWATQFFNARPAESDEIADTMYKTYKYPQINVKLNQRNLTKYTSATEKLWVKYFKEQS